MNPTIAVWGMASKKYLFRMPPHVAGRLLRSDREFEMFDELDGEIWCELLDFHNTVQEIEIFAHKDGNDFFINRDFVVPLEWLFEV